METSQALVELGVLLFISFLGSYINDYYETIVSHEERVCLGKIFIGAITGLGLSLMVLEYAPITGTALTGLRISQVHMVITLVCGIIGFQLFPVIKEIGEWKVIKLIRQHTKHDKEG